MFFRSKKEKEDAQDRAQPSTASARPVAPPSQVSERKDATLPAAPAPAGAKPLAPAEIKKRAEESQRLAAAIGEMVALMLRSPRHRDCKLSDLRRLVMPAVRAGQYALVRAQSRSHGFTAPVAALLWARVSTEVDRRLSEKPDEPIRLGPREWRSGDFLWLVDTVGDQRAINAMLRRLCDSEWKGRSVKARVRDANGQVTARLLDARAAASGSDSAQPLDHRPGGHGA